jgi:ribosomal protein S18 acetylase RimI-like enzyme
MFFVRTAAERDLAKVSELLSETWHATYDALYGAEKVSEIAARWHSVTALKARLERKDSEFVVADDGKALAGMGYAAMAKDRPKTAILHQLYVLPQYQREGIGRDMFAELETCFPDAEKMQLHIEKDNLPAVSFYERLGFEKIGETVDDFAVGIAMLVLEKRLDF